MKNFISLKKILEILFFIKTTYQLSNYLNKEITNIKNIFVMGSRYNQLDKIIKNMLADLLYSFKDVEFIFNLFGYISFRSGLSLVTSFFIVLILMPYWIKNSTECISKWTTNKKHDGPETHYIKKVTSTFGGVLILFSIIISTIIWTSNFSNFNYILILTLVLFGLIGFIDDFKKVKIGKGINFKNQIFISAFSNNNHLFYYQT